MAIVDSTSLFFVDSNRTGHSVSLLFHSPLPSSFLFLTISSPSSMPRSAKERRTYQFEGQFHSKEDFRPPTSAAPPPLGGNRVQLEPTLAEETLGPNGQPNWWKCTYLNCKHTKESKSVSHFHSFSCQKHSGLIGLIGRPGTSSSRT